MSMYEYWIGKDVDFSSTWRDFESGLGYIDKYQTMEVYLIRLTFSQYPSNLPLFNHEAIFKTVKGYFHELKLNCLTSSEYEMAGPLFLYEVSRGSGVWSFLGELRPLILLGTTLADGIILGYEIKNLDMKLKMLHEHFRVTDIRPEDFRRFIRAKTSHDLEFALQKLFEQGLQKVEVSTEPFAGNIQQTQTSLVDLKILLEGNGEESFLTKLRRILAARFSEEELRTLCFDLDIDYDDLPAEGKADKARELISHLKRRNRIHKLLQAGRQSRPDIPWESILS